MDNNHVMLNVKLIENNHDIQHQKLGVFDILKEALVIIFKNFNFFIFIFLVCIPLFCFLVYYERTLVETLDILRQTNDYYDHYWPSPLDLIVIRMTKHVYYKLLQLGFLYLVPLHLLELCIVIVTVDMASKIYAKEETPMTLKEMIKEAIYGARLRGTFITSYYVLFLSTCILLGLIFLATHAVNMSSSITYFFFPVCFGVFILPLLIKYLEWSTMWIMSTAISLLAGIYGGELSILLLIKYLECSAMWNMSIVISLLEGIYGGEAFALSAYFSKGSERRGMILMLVFFVWGLSLRLPCVFFGCYEGGIGIVVRQSLFCLGNVLKWVVCVVYFYDCKKRTLEMKVDEQVGRDINEAVDA
ncbi:hypothetical protein FCV25MIE_21441 [Fagus crenata]